MSEETRRGVAVIALQKIKEAEKKAQKLVHNAREEDALKIIQEAYDEAMKIKEDYLARARKKAEKKKMAIIEKAAGEAEEIRKKTEDEVAALRKKAEDLMPKAADRVARKIKHFLEKGLV